MIVYESLEIRCRIIACVYVFFYGRFLNLLLDSTKGLTHSVFLKLLFLQALDTEYVGIIPAPTLPSSLCAASQSWMFSLVSMVYCCALFTVKHCMCNISNVVYFISRAGFSGLCLPVLCSKAGYLLVFPLTIHHHSHELCLLHSRHVTWSTYLPHHLHSSNSSLLALTGFLAVSEIISIWT